MISFCHFIFVQFGCFCVSVARIYLKTNFFHFPPHIRLIQADYTCEIGCICCSANKKNYTALQIQMSAMIWFVLEVLR